MSLVLVVRGTCPVHLKVLIAHHGVMALGFGVVILIFFFLIAVTYRSQAMSTTYK